MSDLGRILIGLGLLLVFVGVLFTLASRMNIPLGRLPGDFSWKGRGWTVSFPLASSIVISVVLSLILWLLGHFRR
jgi:ribose/xylose/arabinose/galactoside ABC-type transport system permease subunit